MRGVGYGYSIWPRPWHETWQISVANIILIRSTGVEFPTAIAFNLRIKRAAGTLVMSNYDRDTEMVFNTTEEEAERELALGAEKIKIVRCWIVFLLPPPFFLLSSPID